MPRRVQCSSEIHCVRSRNLHPTAAQSPVHASGTATWHVQYGESNYQTLSSPHSDRSFRSRCADDIRIVLVTSSFWHRILKRLVSQRCGYPLSEPHLTCRESNIRSHVLAQWKGGEGACWGGSTGICTYRTKDNSGTISCTALKSKTSSYSGSFALTTLEHRFHSPPLFFPCFGISFFSNSALLSICNSHLT